MAASFSNFQINPPALMKLREPKHLHIYTFTHFHIPHRLLQSFGGWLIFKFSNQPPALLKLREPKHLHIFTFLTGFSKASVAASFSNYQIIKFSNYLPLLARKPGQNNYSPQAGVGFTNGDPLGRGHHDRLGGL